MEIEISRLGDLVLKKIYSGVILETSEGNQIGICMRDDTMEINVCPNGENLDNWWRVNMQDGTIEKMKCNCPLHGSPCENSDNQVGDLLCNDCPDIEDQ